MFSFYEIFFPSSPQPLDVPPPVPACHKFQQHKALCSWRPARYVHCTELVYCSRGEYHCIWFTDLPGDIKLCTALVLVSSGDGTSVTVKQSIATRRRDASA